jgi:hypothetical protein
VPGAGGPPHAAPAARPAADQDTQTTETASGKATEADPGSPDPAPQASAR